MDGGIRFKKNGTTFMFQMFVVQTKKLKEMQELEGGAERQASDDRTK